MRYRKIPVEVEAMKWTGNNKERISLFIGEKSHEFIHGQLHIHTLEGTMLASIGDYIIRGVCGEYYPCKPKIFKQTYEIIE